ncbi:hypothetical protein ACVWZK_006386 [Bradyrhizobium sp. GM0.4]
MPRGDNLHAMYRTGTREYRSRPPANCKAARKVWDHFAANGPIEWIHLLGGYWGCQRPGDGPIEEIENFYSTRYVD